tara:strand:- start:227 stop:421 length:195 start_codon:yes stop_codon:yes gene_type:complete
MGFTLIDINSDNKKDFNNKHGKNYGYKKRNTFRQTDEERNFRIYLYTEGLVDYFKESYIIKQSI